MGLKLWVTQVEMCNQELRDTAGMGVGIWGYCLQEVGDAVGGMKLPGNASWEDVFCPTDRSGSCPSLAAPIPLFLADLGVWWCVS